MYRYTMGTELQDQRKTITVNRMKRLRQCVKGFMGFSEVNTIDLKLDRTISILPKLLTLNSKKIIQLVVKIVSPLLI
jgi:hypothetical protein